MGFTSRPPLRCRQEFQLRVGCRLATQDAGAGVKDDKLTPPFPLSNRCPHLTPLGALKQREQMGLLEVGTSRCMLPLGCTHALGKHN